MSNLKKMLAIGATALALSADAAVSAQAQDLNPRYVDSLNWRISNAAQQGRISWGEARELRGELHSVQPLAWRARSGQIDPRDYHRLAWTVHHIEARTSGYASGYGRSYDRDHDHDRGDWR
jgi:hypothetical protein